MMLRRATVADHAALLALNNQALPAVDEHDEASLVDLISIADFVMVADAGDGSVGGFLIGLRPGTPYASTNYVWFSERYDDFIYVDRVVVGPAGQGAGVGRSLYEAFVAHGRALAAPVFLAEVNTKPRNEQSLRFHKRFGFVEVGEKEAEGGTKRVVMLEYRLQS